MKSSSFLKSFMWLFTSSCFVVLCTQMPAQERGSAIRDQFSLATVCGDYGAVATYGPNIARALGFEVMDGHGNIRGAATANQPGPNDSTRSISQIGISGTYTVDAEGRGTMNLVIAFPGGGVGQCGRGLRDHEDEGDERRVDCDGDRRHAAGAERRD